MRLKLLPPRGHLLSHLSYCDRPAHFGRSFGAEKNTNGACHWSQALNLRHNEERPIPINKNQRLELPISSTDFHGLQGV